MEGREALKSVHRCRWRRQQHSEKNLRTVNTVGFLRRGLTSDNYHEQSHRCYPNNQKCQCSPVVLKPMFVHAQRSLSIEGWQVAPLEDRKLNRFAICCCSRATPRLRAGDGNSPALTGNRSRIKKSRAGRGSRFGRLQFGTRGACSSVANLDAGPVPPIAVPYGIASGPIAGRFIDGSGRYVDGGWLIVAGAARCRRSKHRTNC